MIQFLTPLAVFTAVLWVSGVIVTLFVTYLIYKMRRESKQRNTWENLL